MSCITKDTLFPQNGVVDASVPMGYAGGLCLDYAK
jgi:hypothetical protein